MLKYNKGVVKSEKFLFYVYIINKFTLFQDFHFTFEMARNEGDNSRVAECQQS